MVLHALNFSLWKDANSFLTRDLDEADRRNEEMEDKTRLLTLGIEEKQVFSYPDWNMRHWIAQFFFLLTEFEFQLRPFV